MVDRPIIFSTPMVQAVLYGRKSQTRRVLSPHNLRIWTGGLDYAGRYVQPNADMMQSALNNARIFRMIEGLLHWVTDPAPHQTGAAMAQWMGKLQYAPGDRLWVREAWAHYQTVNHRTRPDGGSYSEVSDGLAGYRADGHDTIEDFRKHVRLMSDCDLEAVEINGDRWRPSIHMPRWASRLTLVVTDVRVERLQDISDADAIAEGITEIRQADKSGLRHFGLSGTNAIDGPTAGHAFAGLWTLVNGADAWADDPWVVAVSFETHHCNIDAMPAAQQRVAA